MNQLETALKAHDWGPGHASTGWRTRPQIDQLMKSHGDPAEAQALWEQYCPWSDANGGYIKWAQR